MRRIVILWLCAAALALAQTAPVKGKKSAAAPAAGSTNPAAPAAAHITAQAASQPAARQRQTKVFDVKYADVAALGGMIDDLRQGSSPDRVIAQPGLHAIAIEAYTPAFLQSAEELIRRYDVPPSGAAQTHDFEIVAHILLAGRATVTGTALPKSLEGVARQLKDTFGYTDVKLIDSAVAQAREGGGAMAKGTVNGLSDGATQPSAYEMSSRAARYEPGQKKGAIALDGFQFKLRLAYMSADAAASTVQWQEAIFQTDLRIPEGQTVVAGKSKAGAGNDALILVVTARTSE